MGSAVDKVHRESMEGGKKGLREEGGRKVRDAADLLILIRICQALLYSTSTYGLP